MSINQILILAVLVEALVNTVKPFWVRPRPWPIAETVAIGLGILVAVAAGMDLFATVEMPLAVPFLGSVLTGIIASRGSNIVAKLVKLLDETRAAKRHSGSQGREFGA